MAIAFARLQFVKRSAGKNSCAKASYNARSIIEFHGNDTDQKHTYNWTHKEKPAFHEVLLPGHVNTKFKDPEVLWNSIESIEKRKDSQTAMELVLALPDDKEVSLDDKIHLIKTFIDREFVKNGLGAQVDIHRPENHKTYQEGESDPDEKNHNWHAHVLVTTRQFDESGEAFEKKKNRDLMPSVRVFGVVAGENWGKLWAQHQNEFFEEKGMPLRVDINGIVPQMHLGPRRMRGRVLHLLDTQDALLEKNIQEFKNPEQILTKISETKSIFTLTEVNEFLNKYLDHSAASLIKEDILKHPSLVQLYDKKTAAPLDKFTTVGVLQEEKKIIRLADRLHTRSHSSISESSVNRENLQGLNGEQLLAFNQILAGPAISLIEGHAGTGKSYLMRALKKTYEDAGFRVRGFGPDNSTAQVLKGHGFIDASNIHKFLFSISHKKDAIKDGSEVWIVDESGKLGNKALSELLKRAESNKIKLVFAGNSAQLPSVERGGMFKQFCERYGCSILEDIQRQKDVSQREIAKQLATGDISRAFDAISSTGGFVWAKTREDAMDALVKKWAIDKAHFPTSKTLMIAHSNVEVKALNELARSYLRDSQMISEKEFECTTSRGKIFISEGDLVVFRRNDSHLRVMNGTMGTLTKASEDQFIVSVKDDGKDRDVIFNPKMFNSFQLGYASTYDRAQGETVDRAYILHSAHINKEMFYVGLTRHVRNVTCFVAKTNAKNVAELKKQAFKSAVKETTSDYTTKSEIQAVQANNDRESEISALKSSTSLMDQARGYGREVFGIVKEKIGKTVEKYSDRISDRDFYSYQEAKETTPHGVIEVKDEVKLPAVEKTIVEALQAEKKSEIKDQDEVQRQSGRKSAYSKLNPEQQTLLKSYFKKSDDAAALYEIYKAEFASDGHQKDISEAQGKWKSACTERNKLAYDVYNSIAKSDKKDLFSQKSLEILEDRSAKYEALTQPKVNLIHDLNNNLESLILKLFPEGPSRKNNREFRFGSKGSLCVTHSGSKSGTYYDFEKSEGGNLLKLIEKELSLNSSEAKKWAAEFLHMAPSVEVTRQFAIPRTAKKEEEWVSIKPSQEVNDGEIQEIMRPFKDGYTLSAKHTYRDADGKSLFYVLRLQNVENPSKKLPLPMSYGYWKGSAGEKKWALKGYQTESDAKPIYNLDLLYRSPSKRVLIVEGEKTADAANKLLGKDFVCIAWQGGSGAASKAQWQHLFGREVVIWPDNDDAGFKAANEIISCLKKVGVKSLKLVDETTLRKELPEKWDLADPLPQSKDHKFIADSILRAQPKAIGLDRLNSITVGKNGKSIDLGVANEVLWRVDARLRVDLEKDHQGKTWDVESGILKEVSAILKSKEALKCEVCKLVGSSVHDDNLVKQAMIYMAKTGNAPSNEFYNQAIIDSRAIAAQEVNLMSAVYSDHQVAVQRESVIAKKQIEKNENGIDSSMQK